MKKRIEQEVKTVNSLYAAVASNAAWNWVGTRSNGAWISPGLPSCPQAAIWSSPLLHLQKTTHPASARMFRNSIIVFLLLDLNRDPEWGLKEMRLILQGIPLTRSINLLASSTLSWWKFRFRLSTSIQWQVKYKHIRAETTALYLSLIPASITYSNNTL